MRIVGVFLAPRFPPDTCGGMGARDSVFAMSNHEDPHPKKKVTAATTDAPQEEFIESENIPSQVEKPAEGNSAGSEDKSSGGQ